ncbi:MAG: hypothetical protein K9H49_04605 [Bacteroidales bacterium]|nr:hypothetical protein [Bacteroidales bacterium]MCF8389096.1 hypothetical protein [Bacteroidales bacterium]
MKKPLFIVFVIFIMCSAYGQEWNYARLSVLYGGSIPFNFNSIEKYEKGIEILDGTILGITLADSSALGTILEGFVLNIRTFNGATEILGDVSTLSLDKIRVRADNYLGLGAGTSYGYQDLSAVWNAIFSYSNLSFTDLTWDSHQLSISYGAESH